MSHGAVGQVPFWCGKKYADEAFSEGTFLVRDIPEITIG